MLCLCGFELYSRWVPLNKNNRTDFSGGKLYNEAFRVEYFSTIREKTLS